MEASIAFYETSNQEALKKYQNIDYRIKKTQVCWLGRALFFIFDNFF